MSKDFLSEHGFSPEEQIKAGASAEHGYKEDTDFDEQTRRISWALKNLHQSGYGPHDIHIDNNGDPHAIHRVGEWHAKYFGGPYLEIFHNSRPNDTLDVIQHSEYPHKDLWAINHLELKDWVSRHGQEVKEHYGIK